MGRYLDILERTDSCDISDISDQSPTYARANRSVCNPESTFGRFGRTLRALEARCPELVESDDWERAVADARAFIARWVEQAERLGWTATDCSGYFRSLRSHIRLFGDSHDTTQLDSSGCCAADPLLL
jgi:hypothetical protein